MDDMTKTTARKTRERPRVYQLDPRARVACWTSFVSSLDRLLQETNNNIQQGIVGSSNHDSEFEDVDKCRSDKSSSHLSDVTYNSEYESGMMTMTDGEEETLDLPPAHDLVEKSAEKAFAEQLPPVTDGNQVEDSTVVDCSSLPSAYRTRNITSNSDYDNYSDWTNVEATPKPEREPDLQGAEQVVDSLKPVREDDYEEYLSMSSSSSYVSGSESESEFLSSFSTSGQSIPSTCFTLTSWCRSSPMIADLSSYSSTSNFGCKLTVVPSCSPVLFSEAERLACGNGNYVLDSDESCVLEQHPIMEDLFMEIDRTIEWYSKVFLAIVLLVLINFLL